MGNQMGYNSKSAQKAMMKTTDQMDSSLKKNLVLDSYDEEEQALAKARNRVHT